MTAWPWVVVWSLTGPGLGAGPPLQRFERAQPHMGTTIRLTFYAPDEKVATTAADAAFARVRFLDKDVFSDYVSTSEVGRVNAAAGKAAVKVSPEFLLLLGEAGELHRRTGGAFDVSVGPLAKVWRTARKVHKLPSPEKIAAARALVGLDRVTADSAAHTVRLGTAGMALDFGGLAKGYAADQALDELAKHGVTRAVVACGGDVVCRDPPPDKPGWTVEVQPIPIVRKTRDAVVVERPPGPPTRLVVANKAVSTAGDASQYLQIGATRYSHIVDPKTGLGMTVRRQTTVVARTGLEADGLETSVNLIGPAAGERMTADKPWCAFRCTEVRGVDELVTVDSKTWAAVAPPR